MFNLKEVRRVYRQLWVVFFAVLVGVTAHASDLSIYQPAQNGTVSMIMMLDTSGSMGDGTGYGTGTSSIIGDYVFGSATAACTTANTSKTTTTKGVTTTTWTYNNAYSNTQDVIPTNGYSFQLVVPAATVNGQALPSFTLNYCPAPTVAIGQNCYATASYLTTIAAGATLAPNAINGLTTSTHNTTAGTTGTASTNGGIGTYCFDRISRLKMGMFGVLINNSTAVQNTIMGVGHFSAPNGGSGSSTAADGTNAEILVPAVLLNKVNGTTPTATPPTTNQRYILASAISNLVAWNGTPTANGYAEAAAYLLGNKATSTGITYAKSNSVPGAGSVTVLNSGQTAYNSPVVANKSTSCGQGVYLLSDGEPNAPGASAAGTNMKAALGTTFSCPSTGTAITGITPSTSTILSTKSTTSTSSAWECMGSFAQALNNSNSLASDGNKYPIQTAFVAFGTDFQGLTIGTPGTNTYYYDAVNACELASRQTGDLCSSNIPGTSTTNSNGGYGSGGFYFATTPSQVTTSVQGFIQTLSSAKVAPLTTGSATTPVDSLNPNGFQPYAYLRAVSPNPADTSAMSWAGNIKKYAVNSSGIIVDAKGNYVFQNTGALVGVNTSTGVITPSTYDLWNASSLADGGLVVDTSIAGTAYPASGTLDKIPMPTSAVSPRTLRPLFTDLDSLTGKDLMLTAGANQALLKIPATGTTLTEAGILGLFTGSGSKVPYNAVSVPASPVTNLITPAVQIELLNFLGYNLPLNSTLPTTAAALTTL